MPLLNLDAGELATETEELWALFDLLACACGGHTGDAASMARVAAFCARSGVRLGAHPSYPDRAGFGRRTIAIAPADLRASLAEQLAALAAFGPVEAVKPHGALYHDAAREPAIAEIVLDAVGDLTIIGPPTGALREAAARRGV